MSSNAENALRVDQTSPVTPYKCAMDERSEQQFVIIQLFFRLWVSCEQHLKSAIEQKAIYAVRLHTAADTVRYFEDESAPAVLVQDSCATQPGQSRSYDNDIGFVHDCLLHCLVRSQVSSLTESKPSRP